MPKYIVNVDHGLPPGERKYAFGTEFESDDPRCEEWVRKGYATPVPEVGEPSDDPPVQVGPTLAEGEVATLDTTSATASVALIITKKMRGRLQKLGYTDAQIDAMTAQLANDILQLGTPAPTV